MTTAHPLAYNSQYLQPHLSEIANGAAKAATMAWEAVFDGFICGQTTWLSRSIDNLTQRILPPATAKVASTFIQTLPHLALALTLPFYPFLGVTVSCIAGRIYSGLSKPKEALNPVSDFELGQVTAYGIRGVQQLTQGIMTKNPIDILWGSANILCVGLGYLEKGVFGDIKNALFELSQRNR